MMEVFYHGETGNTERENGKCKREDGKCEIYQNEIKKPKR
jgi:hypothetical protein